jgi:hypothetical protein
MFIEELRMRCLIPAVLFLGFTGLVFGQHGGGGGVGGGARGGGGGGRGYSRGFANPGRVPHPTHGIAGVVPYPVFYGGYYDGSYDGSGSYGYDPSAAGYAPGYGPGYYGSGYADDGSQANGPGMPSVVINQSYAPQRSNPQVREYTGDPTQDQSSGQSTGLKLYQAPPSHPYADAQRAANGDQPTIYLIAFRDHTIVQALGYWMEGNTLHYVSAEQTLNQVSIDLVDRDLSQRLNSERGLDFHLPQPR